MLHIILASITIVVRPIVMHIVVAATGLAIGGLTLILCAPTNVVVVVLILVIGIGVTCVNVRMIMMFARLVMTNVPTLVGQQLVAVNRGTLVLVRALLEAQLIPSVQLLAQ